MNQHLKILYKTFIREKINSLYIADNSNCKILGENFVDKYYMLIMEDWNLNKNHRKPDFHLIIENCINPEVLTFKYINRNDRYVRIEKQIVQNHEVFKYLVKQGLFLNPSTADNENNSQILVHRLVLCLYDNICGFECHHGDKVKNNNGISNLMPIEHFNHKKLDDAPTPKFEEQTKALQKEFITKIFKAKRNTLSSRDRIVFLVLTELNSGMSVAQIAKKYAKKIKETTIRKIKNYYFYCDEFLKYLYFRITTGFSPFNEVLRYQWDIPLNFGIKNNPDSQEQCELFGYMLPYLKRMFEKT